MQQLRTVADYIRWTLSRMNQQTLFYGHGTDNSFDEARYLVLSILHLPFSLPDLYLTANVTADEAQQLHTAIQRRVEERIPIPYLAHEAWFCNMSFYVDERVLIPRSPIAELIEQQFAPWYDPEQITTVLDLCTGSGCIAIATAVALPDAKVVASDISADALAVAAINVERYQLADQVELVKSDLFSAIHAGKQFDLIVSNPPYVDQYEMEHLPQEYRHEPRMALEAGSDGLDLVRHILAQAAGYLSDNGLLIVEVGASQHHIESSFPTVPFTWIEFERGGEGVFILSRQQLTKYAAAFSQE